MIADFIPMIAGYIPVSVDYISVSLGPPVIASGYIPMIAGSHNLVPTSQKLVNKPLNYNCPVVSIKTALWLYGFVQFNVPTITSHCS